MSTTKQSELDRLTSEVEALQPEIDRLARNERRWGMAVRVVLSVVVIVAGLGQCPLLPEWVGLVGTASALWFIWSE